MEMRLICIITSMTIFTVLNSAKANGDIISDNCDTLLAMGFNIFECVKSAYPDRAECVPRGHRNGNRLRRGRLGDGGFDPMNAVCDSIIDCEDGSDEMLAECEPRHREYCVDELEKEVDGEYLNSFRCYDRGDEASVPVSMAMCVSECQLCDGRKDCPNGADEMAKNCRNMKPRPDACKFF